MNLKDYTIVYRGECTKKPLNGRPSKVPDSHWYSLPVPRVDNINTGALSEWWCGCTRKTDIFKWWCKKDFKYHPKNFKIRVLAVPKDLIVKGSTQCIFDRRKAKIVGTLNADGTICLQNKALLPLLKTRKVTFSA
jgi:hypothetical protein